MVIYSSMLVAYVVVPLQLD